MTYTAYVFHQPNVPETASTEEETSEVEVTSETQEDEDDSDSFVEVPESDCEDDERYTMWRSLVLSTAPSGPFPYYDYEDNDDDDVDDWYVEVTDDEDDVSLLILINIKVHYLILTPPLHNKRPSQRTRQRA